MEDKFKNLNKLHKEFTEISNEIYFISNMKKFKENELKLIKSSDLISENTKEDLTNIYQEFYAKLEDVMKASKIKSKELSKQINKLTK